jgi:hypothetical protein
MQQDLRGGGGADGGALGYPPEQLFQEVAYLAYYFHWSHSEIMDMNHIERLRWVNELARINRTLNEPSDGDSFD